MLKLKWDGNESWFLFVMLECVEEVTGLNCTHFVVDETLFINLWDSTLLAFGGTYLPGDEMMLDCHGLWKIHDETVSAVYTF